jgi:hypothetical protein
MHIQAGQRRSVVWVPLRSCEQLLLISGSNSVCTAALLAHASPTLAKSRQQQQQQQQLSWLAGGRQAAGGRAGRQAHVAPAQ